MGLNISSSQPSQILRKESVVTTQKVSSKEEREQETTLCLIPFFVMTYNSVVSLTLLVFKEDRDYY